ncbi:MAG: GNAT family N-acetyltransferase [Pseudomonadota bacterium]
MVLGQEHPLRPLFDPRSIAVFGASERPDSVGQKVFSRLVNSGFAGDIHAVNPKYDHVFGAPCSPSLIDHPPIDLAIFCTRPHRYARILKSCKDHGIANAIILSLGDEIFGPSRELLEGIRILGPDSIGILRPWSKLQLGLLPGNARKGPLAVVSQSSSLCAAISDSAMPNHLGLSALISLGSEADVSIEETIEFLADDDVTKAILIHIDRINSGPRLYSALRYATWRKPVVVLTGGSVQRTQGGSEDTVFDAMLCRAGAVRASTFGELFAAAEILSSGARVNGQRLAIISNSMGAAQLAEDRASQLDLDVTRTRVCAANGSSYHRLNRDRSGHLSFVAEVESSIEADDVDGVVTVLAPTPFAEIEHVASKLTSIPRRGQSKPILACCMGRTSTEDARTALSSAGFPDFSLPERAVEAFAVLATHKKRYDLALEVPGPRAVSSRSLRRLKAITDDHEGWLLKQQVRDLLAELGLKFDVQGESEKIDFSASVGVFVSEDASFGANIRIEPVVHETVIDWRDRTAVELLPLTSVLAERLIESSKVSSTFRDPGRGQDLVKLLLRISDMVCVLPSIAEIRLLMAESTSGHTTVIEASVKVTPSARRQAKLTFAPYPSHLDNFVTLRDGSRLHIRPIRPEDAEQEGAFVRQLSNKSRRFRFFGAMKALSDEQLVRFTQLDFSRELALVALCKDQAVERQIAVARYCKLPGGTSAEFAIVVDDNFQRKGIARILMEQLTFAAQQSGVIRFCGTVLKSNKAMRGLALSLGLQETNDETDDEIVRYEISLNQSA